MTDPVDEFGRIALHYAARDGDDLVVTQLIGAGANVNLRDAGGWTPLHFAAQAGSLRTVETLISAGAAVNSPDAHGNTPLFRAVFGAKNDGSVIQALRAAGADPTIKNKAGVSPLILARRIGNYNVAQFFSDMPEPDV